MSESRFAGVRAQVQTVRRASVAGALVLFAVFAGLARASHPGTTGTPSNGSGSITPATSSDDSSSGFSFGEGDVGPSSGSVPQVQSGGS